MKLATLVLAGLFGTTVLGSNGDHATSASGAAAGMGGTAMANYTTETEALFRNPSLLGSTLKETFQPRLEFSASIGKHTSEGAMDVGTGTLPAYTASKDKVTFLPNIAAGMKVTEELSAGLGIVALGGSTVDYSGTGQLSDQKAEQFMYRLTPALSYKLADNFRLGAGLVVGYTSLALNSSGSTRPSSTSIGAGGIFGAFYTPFENFHLGASVLTKSKYSFKDLFDVSSLTTIATASGTLNTIEFQHPAEYALGVAYDLDNLRLALDYRFIAWSTAMGYRELGWRDQNVLALGVQYKMDSLTLRTGAVYGRSPIVDRTGVDGDAVGDFQGTAVTQGGVDIANVSGFTTIIEWEFDFGASYQFTPSLSADLALTLSPAKTVTVSGSSSAGPYIVSSKASEWYVVTGVNYQF